MTEKKKTWFGYKSKGKPPVQDDKPLAKSKKISKAAQKEFGLEKLPGNKGYVKTVDIDPKASKVKAKPLKTSKAKPKLPKKKVTASRVIRWSEGKDGFEYISGADVATEIRKNEDCYVMDGSDTAIVFTKKVEISVTKINENSVFQPHEKTNKNVYCAVIVFEFNHIMEEYHSRQFAMQDISQRYKPYVKRGAKVYVIRDISEIEGVIKGIE